jgi:peptide chain release factor 1
MQMFDTLADIERRYLAIEEEMGQPEVVTDHLRLSALGRERAEIEETVAAYRRLRDLSDEISATEAMADEERDPEMAALAREELDTLTQQRDEQMAAIRRMLVPRDPNDERDVIVEIRAGTGGEEAALFAAELYRMYTKYAERQRWKVELIDLNETGIGGMKEVVFEVHGKGAFAHLRWESGVHRVQRVPATESGGRIHTSTATVIGHAVLREVVGANLLAAVAGADLGFPLGGERLLLLLQCHVVQPRPEHRERLVPVL